MLSRSLFHVCVLSLIAWAGSAAQAQSSPPSEPTSTPIAPSSSDLQDAPAGYQEAVDQAVSELHAEHFSEARALFVHAHELMPSAGTLRGIGFAEFELRSYVESIKHTKQALDSQVRPLSPEYRKETETLLERANRFVTRLTLHVLPAAATVTLDGESLSQSADEIVLLVAGDHTIEASAPAHLSERRVVHALGGDTQRVSISLAPVATTPSAGPVDPHDDERPRLLRKNPWLWAGVGVLVAGAALSAGLLARRDADSTEPYGGSAKVSIPGL